MNQTDYEIRTEERGLRNLLVLTGQVGPDAANRLRAEAERLAAGAGAVDLDWREAEMLSASSLQVLVALKISLSKRGRTLQVSGDNPNLRRLLDLAGLSSMFPCRKLAE